MLESTQSDACRWRIGKSLFVFFHLFCYQVTRCCCLQYERQRIRHDARRTTCRSDRSQSSMCRSKRAQLELTYDIGYQRSKRWWLSCTRTRRRRSARRLRRQSPTHRPCALVLDDDGQRGEMKELFVGFCVNGSLVSLAVDLAVAGTSRFTELKSSKTQKKTRFVAADAERISIAKRLDAALEQVRFLLFCCYHRHRT